MSKSQLADIVAKAASQDISTDQAVKQINATYDVRSKRQLKAFRATLRAPRYEHVMEYHTVKELYEQLNHTESGVFYMLFLHTKFKKSGVLVSGSTPMKQSDLILITGLQDRQLRKVLNKLAELNLLLKAGVKNKQTYAINPAYVRIGEGTKEKVPFTRLYKATGKYAQSKLTAKQFGFLVKLSLYIDFNTHVLAKNPYERDIDQIEPLVVKDIAELMGDSVQTTKEYIKALINAGFLHSEGAEGTPLTKKSFYIHPQIACRGNEEGKSYGLLLSEFLDLHKVIPYEEGRKFKKKATEFLERIRSMNP